MGEELTSFPGFLEELNKKSLSNITIVAGHHPCGIHEVFEYSGESRYFSFVREPIKRVNSQYNFSLSSKSRNEQMKNLILENEITLYDWLDRDYVMHNVQTFFFSGVERETFKSNPQNPKFLEMAIENIKKHFFFIGLTEDFDRSLIPIRHLLNWKIIPYYAKLNVVREKKKLDQKTIDKIKEKNSLDIELYNFCKKRYQEQICQLSKKIDIDNELQKLKKMNALIGKFKLYRWLILKRLAFQLSKQFITKKQELPASPRDELFMKKLTRHYH